MITDTEFKNEALQGGGYIALAKVLVRPTGYVVVWPLFLKCLRHSRSCLRLQEELAAVPQNFKDAERTATESPGFSTDFGFSLNVSRLDAFNESVLKLKIS